MLFPFREPPSTVPRSLRRRHAPVAPLHRGPVPLQLEDLVEHPLDQVMPVQDADWGVDAATLRREGVGVPN